MRYLFLHPVFPGQFHKVMEALVRAGHEVVHCSQRSALRDIAGVKKLTYHLPAVSQPHPLLQKVEEYWVHGQAVLQTALQLKAQGFIPDLIYGYAGWGPTLFMKDVFPHTPLIGYFEWFLNAFGAEYNFDPAYPLAFERQLYLRGFNMPMLLDLQTCDAGITPTHWQKQQFPTAFHSKLSVIHDGVDTTYYQPAPNAVLRIPDLGLDLTGVTEIITYATRGMEPFRGFPQFMQALALLQKRKPHCHVVIVGNDETHYSRTPEKGKSYKDLLLAELELDLTRLHFTGWLPLPAYRRVLQASTVHVYLTYPYVLSWSLLEAMASGCVVVGSRTPPVEEVLRDGENGLLVDFFSPTALADKLEEALTPSPRWDTLRQAARQTVLDHYALDKLIPQHLTRLEQLQRHFDTR